MPFFTQLGALHNHRVYKKVSCSYENLNCLQNNIFFLLGSILIALQAEPYDIHGQSHQHHIIYNANVSPWHVHGFSLALRYPGEMSCGFLQGPI